jgi:NNP family nitrate/nitrite transporter-like MFS transporter
VGDRILRKQLLAGGTTTIRFAPSIWLFTALVFIVGIAMGIGKAAVYKYIPEYFPGEVGAVGGLVGVIGGLGGFVCPILFGYLLRATGLWTSCWAFLFGLSVLCLTWLHVVVLRIERPQPRAIESASEPDTEPSALPVPAEGALS